MKRAKKIIFQCKGNKKSSIRNVQVSTVHIKVLHAYFWIHTSCSNAAKLDVSGVVKVQRGQSRSFLESLGEVDQVAYFTVFRRLKTHKVKTSELQERAFVITA